MNETTGEASTGEKDAAREAPIVEEGVLKNPQHRFRFPVPPGWTLQPGATADEMVFEAEDCEECVLKVVVSAGNDLPLDETVRELRSLVDSSAETRIVGEERIRVARVPGYTLVKEQGPAAAEGAEPREAPAPGGTGAGGLVRARYVTFDHKGTKFYLFLRTPAGRFAEADAAFNELLSRFRFKL